MSVRQASKDFFLEASRFADSKPETAERYWNAFVETIVRRIYMEGSVYIPKIGTMTVKNIMQQSQFQRDPRTGEIVEYVMPEHYKPIFTAEEQFISDINGTGVTKAYRKRLKNNRLTKRDYERMKRTDQIEKVFDNEKLREEMQNSFAEILERKKNYAEQRKEQENNAKTDT